MPKTVQVSATTQVFIEEDDLLKSVIDIANKSKAGRWVEMSKSRDGSMHKVLMEEVHTSHRFDHPCDDQSKKALEIVESADALMSALQRFRIATGRL